MGFPAICQRFALASCRTTNRDFLRLAQPSISVLSHKNVTKGLNNVNYLSNNFNNLRQYSARACSSYVAASDRKSDVLTRKTFSPLNNFKLQECIQITPRVSYKSSVASFQQHVRCYASSVEPNLPDEDLLNDPLFEPKVTSPVPLRVVVIGWMGCKKRYIEKFARLWARSGDHEVIVLRPSVIQTLVPFFGIVSGGKTLDKVAKFQRENPDLPTVYHIFSTGGFIMAGTLWRWVDEVDDVAVRRHLLEDAQGIIFDSGPAPVEADMAARAIVSAVTHSAAESVVERFPLLVNSTRSFLSWWLSRDAVRLREKEVLEAWYYFAPLCPQLYLYGDADPLVSPDDIEGYRRVQESRGISTRSHTFRDSGHVDHFRRHPHEYAHRMSQFLAEVVRRVPTINHEPEDQIQV